MISGTVAVPIYNSVGIAWLVMESLCRQNKPINGWELIVFEEQHPTQIGEEWVRAYEERLAEVGCERVLYLTSETKVPLSIKWGDMARASAETSEYFCMCGCDDYFHPYHLIEAEGA